MESTSEGNSQRLMGAMEMEMGTLLQDGTEEKWEAISDLDAFFSRVYDYFNERGLRCIITARIINLLTLLFTITFTVFLLDVMNWQGLLYLCVSEETCASVPLVKADYLSHASFFSAHPSFFLSLYILLFAGYLIWSVAHFFLDLRPLLEMHALFQDKLHICDTDLQAIQWDTVVQRIVDLQQTSRLCIVKDQLTAHDIANRILRKENFMVAFVNRGLLPLQPLEPLPGLRLNLLTKTLEWNLYKCILDAMFDQHFRIRQSFTQDIAGLRRRFVLAGILNLLLSPFIMTLMLFYFLLKHAEEIHGHRAKASAFARYYSRHAEWMMREFNELPHTFEARLHASLRDANAYVEQFPNPPLSMVARFVTFLLGSIAAVVLVLSMLNENVLLFWHPGGRPDAEPAHDLLWWLAVLSAVLAVSRALASAAPRESLQMQPNLLLQSVARHTHYMPERWRGRGAMRETYLEFICLFQYQLVLLLQEILGCITTPLLLLFALPRRAPQILEFIRSFTVYVEGVGHVCGFALFDFERHGDSRYGAPVSGEAEQRSRDGKMEKAYLSFRANHPSWRDDTPQGAELLSKIGGNGSAEAVHHTAAAAAAAACAAGSASCAASTLGGTLAADLSAIELAAAAAAAAAGSASCGGGACGLGATMGMGMGMGGTVGTLGGTLGADASMSASQILLLTQSLAPLSCRASHLLTRSMNGGGGGGLGASSGQLAPIDEAAGTPGGGGSFPGGGSLLYRHGGLNGGVGGGGAHGGGGAADGGGTLGSLSGTVFSHGDTEAELLNAELYSRMDLFFAAASQHRSHPPPPPEQHSQYEQYELREQHHGQQHGQQHEQPPVQHEQPGQPGLASAAAPLLPLEEGGPSSAHAAADPTPRPSTSHAATAAVVSAESEPASPTYAAAGVAQRSSHAAPSHDY